MNFIPNPAANDAPSNELTLLRAERDRLLRIIEAQSGIGTLLAAKPSQNTVCWFLISLSLLLVLVLMLVAWFYFYQLERISEGTDSGTCAYGAPRIRRKGLAGEAHRVALRQTPFLA